MDQNNQNNQGSQSGETAKEPRKITTTVTCPHCNQTFEVAVEVPEETGTPKMAWEG